MTFKSIAVAMLFFFLCMTGCEKKDEEGSHSESRRAGDQVIIEVNGAPIYQKEFDVEYAFFNKRFGESVEPGEESNQKIEELIYKKLIDRMLIMQEANRLHMVLTDSETEKAISDNSRGYSKDEFQKAIRKSGLTFTEWRKQFAYNLLVKKILSEVIDKSIKISGKEIEAYYQRNIREFDQPLKVRVFQIVLLTKEGAEEIRSELLDGADFESLAKEKSIAPEGEKGGDLGYFAAGQMPEEFDEAIFAMKPGEISEVVQTPFGYHMFKLVDKKTPEKVDRKKAIELVKKRLYDEKRDLAFRVWKNRLIEKSVVVKKVVNQGKDQ